MKDRHDELVGILAFILTASDAELWMIAEACESRKLALASDETKPVGKLLPFSAALVSDAMRGNKDKAPPQQ